MSRKTKQIEQQARDLIAQYIPAIGNNEIYERDGEHYQALFIGTCFSITPSGKYYLPFACSNVEPCPNCKGEREVINPRFKRKSFERAHRRDRRTRRNAMRNLGFAFQGKWPQSLCDKLERTQAKFHRYAPTLTCPHCRGIGSQEAYWDEVFNEALNDAAGEHGAFIESGEGDPCDYFLVKHIPENEVALREVCEAFDAKVVQEGYLTESAFAIGCTAELAAGLRACEYTPWFKTIEELRDHCLENKEDLLEEAKALLS